MSRWRAAAINLSISVLAVLLAAALLFGLWYPPPYFHAAGADVLVLLLVGVDLVIGPLLTLIVFRAGKRGLALDLCSIAVLQTVALVYGLSVVLESRPVFLVGVVDRFVLVSANEITDEDLASGTEPEFRQRSWLGPRLVAAELPEDPVERSNLTSIVFTGHDIQDMPKYYHAYSDAGKHLLPKAKALDVLQRMSPQHRDEVTRWLRQSGRTGQSVAWLPLQARKADLTMLVDAESAKPLQALALDPWQ